MMLSILIPTCQHDAGQLVRDLGILAKREGIDYEIIVADDASADGAAWLDALADVPRVRTFRWPQNVGRAVGRNKLAQKAQGDWLLMVDDDAGVGAEFSLAAYLKASAEAPVVCGGLLTPDPCPTPSVSLRYKYEHAAQPRRCTRQRVRRPYQHFSTFNFLISKAVFEQVGGFDSSCKEYGHEDTLFGAMLERFGIPLLHIFNPLIHLGLDENELFLEKTETALRSLQRLESRLGGYNRLLTLAASVRRAHLTQAVRWLHKRIGPSLRQNLLSDSPSLFLFQLYKLGYFLSLPESSSAKREPQS